MASENISEHRRKLFWAKVSRVHPDNCWRWKAFRTSKGYGFFRLPEVSSAMVHAHRASWILAHGPIPDGLLVCHHCDNPSCVNPAHLFLGTNADNMADRQRKNRAGKPGAKLTPFDVRAIRRRHREGVTVARLAVIYRVKPETVQALLNGVTWKGFV